MLRDYQQQAVTDAIKHLRTDGRCLYVAPCGTGKSYIQIAIQKEMGEECYIVSPVAEEIREKGGACVFTPGVLRNRLLEGRVAPPRWLIIDEAHHDTSETGEQIRLCAGDIPTVAYTATPYRGTPQGTAALRALYGEPYYILTLRDAVDRGLCTLPTCRTVPILDDDIVEITNGEFKLRTLEAKTPWRAAADLVHALWQTPRSTVVSLPSVRSCLLLSEALEDRGVPNVTVTGDTRVTQRAKAFDACIGTSAVLLQVQVVGEGVDLPIRLLIDLSPTLSPVRWLQRLGRAMRPGGESEYVCCNRNLLRHGYLLEGMVPSSAFAEATKAFPILSRRTGIRAFGLEGVGRLKPVIVPLANGMAASAYYVTRTEGHVATQYVAIVLPNTPDPLWAMRVNAGGYGRWQRCDSPTELTGFASVPPYPLSPRQEQWWKRSAKAFGIDPDAKVTAKSFAVLPVLSDLKLKII